jgi:iron complex transport system ATP-binding protein
MHLAKRRWGTLSEGERKRVLVARALMTNPELLLLDEPSAGMDLGGREDLVGYLGELAMDADAPAIVMITHHVEEIPNGFTHAMLLDEGTVVAQGLIDDVLTSENLTKAFHQQISIDKIDGRYFARRTRVPGKHRA